MFECRGVHMRIVKQTTTKDEAAGFAFMDPREDKQCAKNTSSPGEAAWGWLIDMLLHLMTSHALISFMHIFEYPSCSLCFLTASYRVNLLIPLLQSRSNPTRPGEGSKTYSRTHADCSVWSGATSQEEQGQPRNEGRCKTIANSNASSLVPTMSYWSMHNIWVGSSNYQ